MSSLTRYLKMKIEFPEDVIVNKFRWVLWIAGVILIGNFWVLMMYGDTLRSTHLFIVRSTVFYPVAWLNLICGILLLSLLVWGLVSRKRK